MTEHWMTTETITIHRNHTEIISRLLILADVTDFAFTEQEHDSFIYPKKDYLTLTLKTHRTMKDSVIHMLRGASFALNLASRKEFQPKK
jgi:hypothetical protein